MKAVYIGQKEFYKEYIIRFLGESLFFTVPEVSFIFVLQSWCDRKAGKTFHRLHKNKAKWYDKVWSKTLSFVEFNFIRPLYKKERDKTLKRLD